MDKTLRELKYRYHQNPFDIDNANEYIAALERAVGYDPILTLDLNYLQMAVVLEYRDRQSRFSGDTDAWLKSQTINRLFGYLNIDPKLLENKLDSLSEVEFKNLENELLTKHEDNSWYVGHLKNWFLHFRNRHPSRRKQNIT